MRIDDNLPWIVRVAPHTAEIAAIDRDGWRAGCNCHVLGSAVIAQPQCTASVDGGELAHGRVAVFPHRAVFHSRRNRLRLLTLTGSAADQDLRALIGKRVGDSRPIRCAPLLELMLGNWRDRDDA